VVGVLEHRSKVILAGQIQDRGGNHFKENPHE